MLLPRIPPYEQKYVIYKGYQEEGEGQYPIRKTEDFIEQLGSIQNKLAYAAYKGFILGTAFSIYDIKMMSLVKGREAMLARYCYFTIPITSMMVTWMGGIETAKKVLGRDRLVEAHALGSVVPAAVYSVWRRDIYRGIRCYFPMALWAMGYAVSVRDNLVFTIFFGHGDNPNRPSGYYDKYVSGWFLRTDQPYPESSYHSIKDPGPTWKKWDTQED